MRRALMVLNPGSRQGSDADLNDGVERLRASGIAVEQVESQSPEQTCNLIREYCDKTDLLIIGGGDGTVSSCARVIHECGLPFAILPLGTANDLARSLGIGSVAQAFEVIEAGHAADIDLGVVNGHYFFNVANLGLGVRVTNALTPEVKKRWGVLSYLKALSDALARHDQFRVTIDTDGRRHTMRSIQLAVGNGRFYGGGNVVDQGATIDDNLLHLYSLRPQRLWELLTLAPLLRGGRHDLARRVFTEEGSCILINTRPSGMSIHADGEPVTQTPAEFSVISPALTALVPEDSPLLTDEAR